MLLGEISQPLDSEMTVHRSFISSRSSGWLSRM